MYGFIICACFNDVKNNGENDDFRGSMMAMAAQLNAEKNYVDVKEFIQNGFVAFDISQNDCDIEFGMCATCMLFYRKKDTLVTNE